MKRRHEEEGAKEYRKATERFQKVPEKKSERILKDIQ